MTSYSKYKDSGIEWIGQIPEHWEVWKISHAFNKVGSGTTPKSTNREYYDNGTINWVNTGDLNDGILLNINKQITPKAMEDYSVLKVYPSGSLLIAMYGATIGKVSIMGIDGTTNQACCVLSDSNSLLNKFAFYWFIVNKENIVSLAYGGGQPNISQELIKTLKIPAPPIQEQTQIANFLDQKTAELDTAIEQLEQLIDLLQEERTSLINEGVTKGINPDVPMKDTGIEWADRIPTHWKVVKLRYLADITTGDKDTENREDDGIYPFFVRSQKVEKISTFSYDGEAILTAGDGVGVCKVWHYINDKFDFHQRVYMMHNFKDVVGNFLYHFMKSNFIYEVLKLSAKSTVDSLRRPMFLDFPVIVPPLPEQQQIVQHIENQTTRIDTEIKHTQQEIELLKEYKQSLITEAVTGKIDLRQYALTT